MGVDLDQAGKLARDILVEKQALDSQGKHPRLVLLGEVAFALLEADWLKSVRELPWGDSLAYEINRRRATQGKMFLGDGSLLGLWVVKVDTMEGFKVF